MEQFGHCGLSRQNVPQNVFLVFVYKCIFRQEISIKLWKLFGFEELIPVGRSLRLAIALVTLATAATAERSLF